MKKIEAYFDENFDRLAKHVDLSKPRVRANMQKIMAGHLLKNNLIQNRQIAMRLAGAHIEASIWQERTLASDMKIACPEYREHVAIAPAHIY